MRHPMPIREGVMPNSRFPHTLTRKFLKVKAGSAMMPIYRTASDGRVCFMDKCSIMSAFLLPAPVTLSRLWLCVSMKPF